MNNSDSLMKFLTKEDIYVEDRGFSDLVEYKKKNNFKY